MGAVDSKAQQNKGGLIVQTSKPWYYSGEEITGSIYIRMDEDCGAAKLQFKVKGVEKAQFLVQE